MKISCSLVPTSIKEVSVSFLYGLILVIVYLLYATKIAVIIPCDVDFKSVLLDNFIQTDLSLLSVNLYTLYTLSEVELAIGSSKYFILINSSILFNTIFQLEVRKLNSKFKCSHGFSSVLFTLIVWDFIVSKKISVVLLVSLTAILTIVAWTNTTEAILNYCIAIFTGVVLAAIFKKVIPLRTLNLMKNIKS